MLTNILKSNQPIVIFLIIITSVLLWLFSFIEPVAMQIPTDTINMPLYSIIASWISYKSLGGIIFTFLLILLQAFLLVQFNKKYILINYRTYLPAFFFILISGSFVHMHRLNPVIIATLFLFISINFLFSTYRTDYALNRIYLAGFFISLASLFWAPIAVYILIIWISLLILRPFVGREWTVSILGFLTPYLFVFVYYYVFLDESTFNSLLSNYFSSFIFIKSFHALHYSYYIFYGFLLLIIVLASYSVLTNYQKKKIKTRKYFEINWWMFIIGITMFILFKNVKYEIIYLLSLPISFLITEYFYNIRRTWYLNLILVIFIGSIIYIQITAH